VTGSFAFEQFVLDTGDRRLKADDRPVDLNGRYFDALVLLIRERGRLVSKDRFLSEVWDGVPVTDEALTQCIKTLRRQLGDDAARPRFIETVPKHGYRFIAPVEHLDGQPVPNAAPPKDHWRDFVALGSAGTIGGAVAGAIGGLVYGFAASSQSTVGSISVLLVLLCVTLLVAIVGAAGVSFAIATSAFAPARSWSWLTVAGAGGGLVVGAFGKMLGHDVFSLLVGQAPSEITGAMEGLLIGAAVGMGTWLGLGKSPRRAAALGAAAGALAGAAAVLLGGRLMLGSLALLTSDFPDSRLQVGQVGRLFGETGLGPITQFVSATLEAALFGGCVVAALTVAARKLPRP
jgi:DNA-binding winged helix-turn-helix (wHTH) protein